MILRRQEINPNQSEFLITYLSEEVANRQLPILLASIVTCKVTCEITYEVRWIYSQSNDTYVIIICTAVGVADRQLSGVSGI